jgi:hypothetical protein
VFEELHEEVIAAVAETAMRSSDPTEQLRVGCLVFLDACLDPAFARISLIEAPAVLGWAEWRATDSRHGLGLIKEAIGQAIATGAMAPMPIDPLAHLLMAALNEAALVIAGSPDPVAAREEVGGTLDELLARLLV